MNFARAILVAMTVCAATSHAQSVQVDLLAFAMPPTTQEHSTRMIDLLFSRIAQRSDVGITITRFRDEEASLHIVIGRTEEYPRLQTLCERHGVVLPGRDTPFPEGFAVKLVETEDGPMIIAVGADERGVLYAAGEILRRFAYGAETLSVEPYQVATAPAYRYRGFSANQGGTMRQITDARGWTTAELFEVIQDYALAGANMFYVERDGGQLYDYVRSLGLMTITDCRPNEYRGEIPEGWAAGGLERWEGGHWLCPSVPEARAKLMDTWREDFAKRPHHDVFRMYSGDPGGCRDDRCAPWGKTYIELCEEVAAIWREGHEDGIVIIANQDLSNEGDQAIFDYLNAQPRPWLYGLAYGPGSNAMSHYFRDELREDLFAYSGTGPVNRYLRETLNELPAQQKIIHYSDITHWIRSQYEVESPDPYLVRVFGRRTFHTRPQAMYDIFQAIMPFSEGDIIYSEGYHDEFHQYMWARLLWNPNRTCEDVVNEYCTYYFGADAAPIMREAIFQLEENLEAPLRENTGITKYHGLVTAAGKRVPANLLKDDHRWRAHAQKAALDLIVQQRLQKEWAVAQGVLDEIDRGLEDDDLQVALRKAMGALVIEMGPSFSMGELLTQVRQYGDEAENRHGIRNVGAFRLDRPLFDLRRIRARVNAIIAEPDPGIQAIAARELIAAGIDRAQ